METKICLKCGKEFSKRITCSKKEWKKSKYCSKSCANSVNLNGKLFKKGHVSDRKGKKFPETSGKNHWQIKLRGEKPKCKNCGKKLSSRTQKHNLCKPCWAKLKNSGANNVSYKGGYENRLMNNRKRRIMRIGNGGSHTLGEWETLKAQYNWTCPCCKRKEPFTDQRCKHLTEDHIISLKKGGSDNIENIQPLCGSCNSRKQSKIIIYKMVDEK